MQFKMAAGENFAVVTKSGGTLTLPDVENGSSTSLLRLDEAEAGHTDWTYSGLPTGAVITLSPYYASGNWNFEFTVGDVIFLPVDYAPGGEDAISLEWTMMPDDAMTPPVSVTATRVRLPTMSDLARKADKSEMSIAAVSGDTTKRNVQLKSGTAQDVVVEHQQLAERNEFSTWTIYRAGVGVTAQVSQPRRDEYYWWVSSLPTDSGQGNVTGDVDATSLTWRAQEISTGTIVTYTATRTRLPGYVLGDQTTKPLADAKATDDALALRLDKTAVVTALKNDSSTESPIEWTDNTKTTLDLANMTDGGVRKCLAAIIRSCGLSVNV